MNLRLLTLLLSLALPLVACGPIGPGPSDDDDATDDDDDATGDPIESTIGDLNAGNVDIGTPVIVTGVITTPFDSDEDDNEARFWIQDGSGPNTGMQVFTFPDVVEALDDADVGVGDEVEVTGTFDQPFGFNEVRVTAAADILSNGGGSMPTPHPVDASELEAGFADASLEGILVELTDVTAQSAGGWDNYWEWEADDVIIDSLFYYADVQADYAIDSLVGLVFTDFGNAVVAPRWGTDLDFTYPGCDAAADGEVFDVNCREIDEDSDVEIEGLVVVSGTPWWSDNSFFAADAGGELFGGILVSGISSADFDVPEIGSVIDVEGENEEYRGQTELIVFNADDLTDTGDDAPVPVIELTDACDIGEGHEGMLVSVASVTVDQDADGVEFGYYTVEGCTHVQIGAEFWDSRDAFSEDTGGAGEVTELYGIVNDKLDIYYINPRNTDDWATWGSR